MRAFYAIAHRCTTPDDVDEALDDGANGVECDIRHYDGDFWIRHDHSLTAGETRLGRYLEALRRLAIEYGEQFALVLFDLKPDGMSAKRVAELLERIRVELTDDTDLNIVMSFAKLTQAHRFNDIRQMLRQREGIAIDQDNDAAGVAEYFPGADSRICYGDGIDWKVRELVPIYGDVKVDNIDSALWRAIDIKARRGAFRLVYTWTVDSEAAMEFYVGVGLDALLTNDAPQLVRLLRQKKYKHKVRLATRADDAFKVNACPYMPQYLGNGRKKELHDLDRHSTGECKVDEIVVRRPFESAQVPIRLGYNGCAWCMSRYDTG